MLPDLKTFEYKTTILEIPQLVSEPIVSSSSTAAGADAKKKQEKLATSEQCSGSGHGHGEFMEERKRTTCGGPASTSSLCRIVLTPDDKDVGMDLNFTVRPGYGHDCNGH